MLILHILNDGFGTDTSSNYVVAVYVNELQIDSLRVVGHPRKEPWYNLVQRIVDAARHSEAFRRP